MPPNQFVSSIKRVLAPFRADCIDAEVTPAPPTTYDTHVPIIFYGKGIKPGSSYERHNVKDIAPTLAAILGINFPILTTGNVLSDAIK